MNNCIVLTGGGTAGHVVLNILLKDELSKYFKKIIYIGSFNGIEKSLISSRTNYEFFPITTTKFDRSKIFSNIKIPFMLCKGIKEAKILLEKFKPSIVFSKGGYVGLPVVIAAHKLKIPVICHESDLTMGLANRLAKNYASVICTNFLVTAQHGGKKCIRTGSPVSISTKSKYEAKQLLGIKTEKPILLVLGGSLGAKALNKFVFDNLAELTKKYYIIHIVGRNNKKEIKNDSYMQFEFTNQMPLLYRVGDYAVSRAGANTIYELFSNKIPTIFVPLPKGASRGDQIDNAKYFEKIGLSRTLLQENLEIEKLQNLLDFLEKNSKNIKKELENQNFGDGTKKIISLINEKKLKA